MTHVRAISSNNRLPVPAQTPTPGTPLGNLLTFLFLKEALAGKQ